MKKKLLTLLTLLYLCVTGAWATDPVIWNLEKTYSSASESELATSGTNWSYSSNVYTYKKALSNAVLPAEDGTTPFSLTAGLKFTVAAGKLKLGKGYMLMDDSGAHTVTIPTTANQYVNLVVGVGSANKTISVSGGDIDNFTVPVASKAFSINIKATGSSLTISTPSSSGFKLYIYQIAVIDESDVVAPVVPNYGEGSYYKGLSLSLSTETGGASIVYKNDSQTRGFSDLSEEYSSAISMTNTGTRYVTTCATKSVTGGKLYSDLKTYIYTIVGTLPTPVATPAAGTYNSTQNVVLSVENMLPNGVIRYTTNGNTPSSSSPAYTDPIEVSADKTIKAYLFESTGNNQKSSMLTAAYTIVSLTDPSFSLSAISIPSNSTAQIKVGDNDGLDGVTLSNIAYGTDGIVTVNATTGVVTPVTAGTTTITFDTDATVKYNSSTGNEFTITVTTPKCATPTITKGAFNFAKKGYKVTITNNEDGSTLYYSTNNEDWTEYTDVLYATTTTHYYAKSEKASYDDSDVVDLNVANTFDGTKEYIAWVSVSAPANTDLLYNALKGIYNVVPVVYADTYSITASDNIKDADLIFVDDKIAGGNNLAKGLKNFVNVKPMLNLKLWATTTQTGRWGWGTAADLTTPTITFDKNYKFLNGVSYTTGKTVSFFKDGTTGKQVLTLNITAAPEGNVNFGTGTDNNTAMHAIIVSGKLDKQYLGLGLSSANVANYSDNAIIVVKNAIAMMLAGEALNTEIATIPATVGANGYTTFACSYPLDMTDANRPEGLKAYKATRTGANLTFVKLNQTVPAGTGLLLLGETKGGSYNIPVAASGTAVENNALVGVTSPVAKQSVADDTYYFVMKKATEEGDPLKFAPITTTKEVTIPAGKAYVEVPSSAFTGAKALTIAFDDNNATAINGIEEVAPATTKTRKVVKNGRLVIETANGEYTVSGARVK